LPGRDRRFSYALAASSMARIHRIPRVGDKTNLAGYRFEVVDMDGRRGRPRFDYAIEKAARRG